MCTLRAQADQVADLPTVETSSGQEWNLLGSSWPELIFGRPPLVPAATVI